MDDVTLLSWIERGQNIAALLVAMGVAGEFALGFMAGPVRRRVDQAKDAEILRVTEQVASLEAGNLQLRTDLEKAAAESKQREVELEREQQKTAEAQRKSAEAQLALNKVARFAATPRRVILGERNGDGETRRAKFEELKKFANTPTTIVPIRDDEAELLASDTMAALQQMAGWKSVSVIPVASTGIPLGYIEEGVTIVTLRIVDKNAPAPTSPQGPPDVVKALLDLLSLDLGPPAGGPPFAVTWRPDVISNGIMFGLSRYAFNIPLNGVAILVGRRPTQQFFWFAPNLDAAPPKIK